VEAGVAGDSVKFLGPLLMFLVLANACGPAETPRIGGSDPASKPVRGGTLTFVLDADVVDLDPLRSRNVSDRAVQYQIYDSLVSIDASGKIIPWLAQRSTFSDGDTTVTFDLRKDVRYQDGTPFDAESVKWNIDRYRASGSARTAELAPISAVEVIDASKIRFRLKAPFPSLLASLVDRAGMMVSRKAVESGGEDFTRRAFKAGTGPFVLTEVVQDDHVTIERNPDWWGRDRDGDALPYLDRVIFKPILDGDVRLANVRTGAAQVAIRINGKDIPQVRADTTVAYQETPSFSFGSLIPNRAAGFVFNEGRYVKAVAMAIDRKEILGNAFAGFGFVGYGALAPPHFAFDSSFRPYETVDTVGAKRLVEEVGKGPLRFELLIPAGDPAMLQTALLIQAQLAKAEITADLKTVSLGEIQKLQTERKFSGLTLFGWSGRIDPDGNTFDHFRTGGILNEASYSNPQVDKLLDEQRATTDEAKRRAALRAAERIFVLEDPARIWYRFGAAQVLTVKSLQGLEPYPDSLVRLQYAWQRK
jgi:peptide/nickel transport system substrate-binding protein